MCITFFWGFTIQYVLWFRNSWWDILTIIGMVSIKACNKTIFHTWEWVEKGVGGSQQCLIRTCWTAAVLVWGTVTGNAALMSCVNINPAVWLVEFQTLEARFSSVWSHLAARAGIWSSKDSYDMTHRPPVYLFVQPCCMWGSFCVCGVWFDPPSATLCLRGMVTSERPRALTLPSLWNATPQGRPAMSCMQALQSLERLVLIHSPIIPSDCSLTKSGRWPLLLHALLISMCTSTQSIITVTTSTTDI